MEYPMFRSITKQLFKQQISQRNYFAEHNYIYVNGPKTTKTSKINTQNYLHSQSKNIPQTTSNLVDFHDQPRSSQKQSENYPFFQQQKIMQINTIPEINLIIIKEIIFNQMMKKTIIKIINDFIQAKELFLTVLTNQIPSNHTNEMKKHDNLKTIQQLTKTIFYNKTQLIHNLTNSMHNEIPLP